MGAGSSKNDGGSAQKKPPSSPRKPVANVNKQNSESVVKPSDSREIDPKADKSSRDQKIVFNHYNATKLGASSPIKPIEPGKIDKETLKEEKEKKKRSKNDAPAPVSTRSSVTALKFEEDSDFENDIDEVLKMPMATDTSRKGRSKEKKSKDKDVVFQEDNLNNNTYNTYNNNMRSLSSDRRDESLPETYAQRLQRQQYKLQQEMLIREKTILRNPQEWQNYDDDEEEDNDGEDKMDIDSPRKGFDPSKFRAANKGGETKTKKELFTTVSDDLKTPRYLQTTGQDLNDVEVQRRRGSPPKQLPQYNQSEIDLMQQLEQDLL